MKQKKTLNVKENIFSKRSAVKFNLLIVFNLAFLLIYNTPSALAQSGHFADYEKLIAHIENQVAGQDFTIFSAVKEQAGKVKENTKIQITLPRAGKKKLSTEALYEQRSKGVLMVGYFSNCGKCDKMHATGIATAFVLNDEGVCATNDHVLTQLGIRPGSIKDTVPPQERHVFLYDTDGNIYPIAELLTYTEMGDFAIFKIDTKGKKLYPIPFGPTAKVASEVHSITHPTGRELYYYTNGYVARYTSDSKKGSHADRMEVTCDYSVGSSGGPIMDSQGNVIGIVSTTRCIYAWPDNPLTIQMVLKRTVPVSVFKSLIM